MSISCLSNLIGLRGIAGYEAPDSGYYINDLQGITTDQIEAISDLTDHYEPRLVWDDIVNRASRKFEQDVKKHMHPYFTNYSYKRDSITGVIDNDNTTLSAEAFWNGWYFDFTGYSPNLSISFEVVNLHIVSGSTFTVKIFDAITGETLATQGFAVTTGFQSYRLMTTVALWKHRKLFVAYDASGITVKKVDRYDRNLGTTSAVHISTASTVNYSSLTSSNTGMMVSYNLTCSVDNFVCNRISLFTDPYLYLLGVEFCNERIHSDRINRWTLLDVEQADKLRGELHDEYAMIMEGIFKDISLSEYNDECFRCAKPITYKTILP